MAQAGATGPKTKRQQRREEHEAERAADRRRQARHTLARRATRVGVIAGAVLLLGLGARAYFSREMPGQRMEDLGNLHIPTADSPHRPYNSDPPTSGPHLPTLAAWGIHESPIPKELQVHNLEDGGVLVQYNCTDCAELVAKLQDIVGRYKNDVILAPYPGMDARIALTAWTRIDKFNEFDEARVVRFIEAYRGVDHHVRGAN